MLLTRALTLSSAHPGTTNKLIRLLRRSSGCQSLANATFTTTNITATRNEHCRAGRRRGDMFPLHYVEVTARQVFRRLGLASGARNARRLL